MAVAAATFLLLTFTGVQPFTVSSSSCIHRASTHLQDAVGGWGIGQSREMVEEEFARGNRKAFDGYQLEEQGEFMRKVKADKDSMANGELDELMSVAKIAGIDVKDPRENEFSSDLFDDDENLDLSV